MDYTKILTIEPGKRSGKPCIRGMRITVYDVLGYLAGGMKPEEILRDFPELTANDIQACLAFAADGGRRLAMPAAAWQGMRDFEEDLTPEELKLVEARLEAHQKGQIKAVDGEVALRKLRAIFQGMKS